VNRKKVAKKEPPIEPIDLPFDASFLIAVETRTLNLLRTSGNRVAVDFISKSMEKSLSASFSAMNAKLMGGKEEFKRCIAKVDSAAGLSVEFKDIELKNVEAFNYIMHSDPFPKLKGHFEVGGIFSEAVVGFKIKYFFGTGWDYLIAQHLWNDQKDTIYQIHKRGTSSAEDFLRNLKGKGQSGA
jgi:hypothetical protein